MLLSASAFLSLLKIVVLRTIIAAYLPSPFPLPKELRNQTLDIRNTSLMNSSSIVLTAWVSTDKFLLRRLDINSTMTITPEILNISSPNFKIVSSINESTIYENFGLPVDIELPKDAQNVSIRMTGTDWRWTVFGSVRP